MGKSKSKECNDGNRNYFKNLFFYVFFNYHRSYYQIKKVIPVFEINMLDKKMSLVAMETRLK